tara:strand:- start:55182 stop:56315 length:1134 start_codon:yes stop_codon:yes gene_type:complete
MEKATRTSLGRPKKAVSHAINEPQDGPDKWRLLDQLTIAAEEFEMSHRTLTVLKALLTFLPTRHIPQGPAAIVFASNARISERLHGMPESTLRRHLAVLVRAGIMTRHDSPNRKRFARNHGDVIALAFGFDLTPLRVQAEVITAAAAQAQTRAAVLQARRDRILMLRQELIHQGIAAPLLEEINLMLRRKPDEAMMRAMENRLDNLLEEQGTQTATPADMSASDTQNERHIQDSIKSDYDSERQNIGTVDGSAPADNPPMKTPKRDQDVTLAQVLGCCTEFRSYFPSALNNWRDLVQISDRVAPMLGIDQPVIAEAKRIMGLEAAAVTVLCLLEKAATIRSPGAYLRRLTQMARAGGFSLSPMLAALGNRQNCQLTI